MRKWAFLAAGVPETRMATPYRSPLCTPACFHPAQALRRLTDVIEEQSPLLR